MKIAYCKFQPFCLKQKVYIVEDNKTVIKHNVNFTDYVDFSVMLSVLNSEQCETFILYGKKEFLNKYKKAIENKFALKYSKNITVEIEEPTI